MILLGFLNGARTANVKLGFNVRIRREGRTRSKSTPCVGGRDESHAIKIYL